MLRTIDEVIDALGGTAKVAALCNVGTSAVSNWRARGRIPSEKFMIFGEALRAADKEAAPSVFGFDKSEARP